MRRTWIRTLTAAGSLALLVIAGGQAGAEQAGRGGVGVVFNGSVTPHELPRHREAPISVTLMGRIHSTDGSRPPRLSQIELAFGAHGGLDAAGLPLCPRRRLRNATRSQALARCRSALVGRGSILTEVPLAPDRPLLARAAVLAFNGRSHGRPAVWVHAYSASPPVSFVLPFRLHRRRSGAYGVLLRAPVLGVLGRWPRLRSFHITLGRRYLAGGERHSYLSAHCSLPPSFDHLRVPIARATYRFASGPTISTTVRRDCRVRP